MNLFNQPGIYTHFVEYEVFKEFRYTELKSDRTGFYAVYGYDKSQRKWISSLPMAKDKIEDFLSFFVKGCTTSTGEYRIVEMEKYTTNQFDRNPNTQNNAYESYGEPELIYLSKNH